MDRWGTAPPQTLREAGPVRSWNLLHALGPCASAGWIKVRRAQKGEKRCWDIIKLCCSLPSLPKGSCP